MLHTAGLAAGLEWLAGSMRQKYGLVVDLSADPAANLERRDVRVLVFESVRELLFNVVKHAKVDRAAVDLSRTPAGEIRIVISDRGVGLDPAHALASDRQGRVGLGLFSVRERLALLGGRLDVESAPGRGTRVVLVAPAGGSRRHDVRDAAAAQQPLVPTRSGPLTVLVADDHAFVRQGLRELFEEHPEVRIVGEAANGLEAVAQAHALHPDVVVMDVAMPQMDGVEATRRIRAELPSVQIFGLSTEERSHRRHAIEDAGAAGYFTKGVDAHNLVRCLLAVHGGRPPSPDRGR